MSFSVSLFMSLVVIIEDCCWNLRDISFKLIILLGRRPTGRTQDFGSCNRGSNPRAPVIFFTYKPRSTSHI